MSEERRLQPDNNNCELCGEPMPKGEEMFKFHGYSGDCPKPPLQKEPVSPTRQHTKSCPKLYGQECTCDGYHTFEELYDHRIALFIALMRSHPDISWRARLHDDGSSLDGWFIAGMHLPSGDITYHLPDAKWFELDKAEVATVEKAPQWDGHTSGDVEIRLLNFYPPHA